MDELLSEFIAESTEGLAQLDNDLIELEKDPSNTDLLSGIFRTMHTIKGTCGFIGLSRLEKVAHSSENVLGRIRDGEIPVSELAITLILESVDKVKDILGVLEESGTEPEGDDSVLIDKLNEIAEGGSPAGDEASDKPADESNAPEPTDEIVEEVKVEDESEVVTSKKASDLEEETVAQEVELEEQKSTDDEIKAEEPKKEEPLESPKPPVKDTKAEKAEAKGVAKNSAAAVASQTIRVNLEVLENLMTQVSELVLTRNQLLQLVHDRENDEFSVPLQRLNYVTSELQEGVMKTRMQPISNAWNKLPRIIRDLEKELSKKVHLEMLGGDTELDRQVLEMIRDPITHMVRNSADHGIENPEKRMIQGKKEQGTIILNAYHAGGHIIIEIKDDGAGLNTDRIKQKILENNLVPESELEEYNENRIHDFIFHPGFSTAEQVTNVSGRGVGMDVVRTNIEKIGGNVSVKSTPGKGSLFTIQIPLTLAIVSALIIESGGERFALPQLSVLEIVRDSRNSEHVIEFINGAPVMRLREKLLPLISLERVLEIRGHSKKEPVPNSKEREDIKPHKPQHHTPEPHESEEPEMIGEEPKTDPEIEKESFEKPVAENTNDETPSHEDEDKFDSHNKYIIVTQVGSLNFGLIVDQVFDTQEIVVKPVSHMLKKINTFSGNTILGDGSVIMILDPNGIASVLNEVSLNDDVEGSENEKADRMKEDRTSFIVFKADGDQPKAVPLALVARLEDIKMSEVEKSGHSYVIQYRGKLMPLISIDGHMHTEKEGMKPVLVFSDQDRYVGLVVDQIIDIMEERFKLKMKSQNSETFGSAVFDGKTTDIINIDAYLRGVYSNWQIHDLESKNKKANDHILYLESNSFFQNLTTPVLKNEEFSVSEVTTMSAAEKLIDDGGQFGVILLDLDQDLGEVRNFLKLIDEKDSQCYVIGLTSHDIDDRFNDLLGAGLDEVISKLDRTVLVQAITRELQASDSEAA